VHTGVRSTRREIGKEHRDLGGNGIHFRELLKRRNPFPPIPIGRPGNFDTLTGAIPQSWAGIDMGVIGKYGGLIGEKEGKKTTHTRNRTRG